MDATHARTAMLLAAAGLAAWALAATAQEGGGDVTIYRCTGPDGQVVIGNVPCAQGDEQQVRSMARPVDAPPAPRAEPAPQPASTPVPEVRYVQVQPSQPLFECVREDGSTYVNDTGIGEERWVPAWSGGWWPGVGGGVGRPDRPGRPGGRGDLGARGATVPAGSGLSAPPVSRISIPADPPRPDPDIGVRPRPPHGGWPGAAGGTMERDACHALPQAEACARLRDRREDIRRRFFNAQQVERDTLRIEERGLNARIDRDCRTY